MQILPSSVALYSGTSTIENFTCFTNTMPLGTKFSGYLWITYSTSTSSNPKTIEIASVKATVTNPSTSAASSGRIAYVPVQITNFQSSPTAANFQENITFNPSITALSANEASNLGNIRFYLGGTELYSWCESGCSSSSSVATFWIKFPAGLAVGNTVVNMTFLSANTQYDASHAGEAPQLSNIYGYYDNGGSVFNYYDNFTGNSAYGWNTVSMGTYDTMSVSNGITFTAAATPSSAAWNDIAIYYSGSSFPQNTIVDFYINSLPATIGGIRSASPGLSTALGAQPPTADNAGSAMLEYGAGINGVVTKSIEQGTSSSFVNTNVGTGALSSTVITIAYTGSTNQWYSNYAPIGSLNTQSPTGNVYLQLGIASQSTGSPYSISSYWIRDRTYPPNGVMPVSSVLTASISR
jgi:hypothetical protein